MATYTQLTRNEDGEYIREIKNTPETFYIERSYNTIETYEVEADSAEDAIDQIYSDDILPVSVSDNIDVSEYEVK